MVSRKPAPVSARATEDACFKTPRPRPVLWDYWQWEHALTFLSGGFACVAQVAQSPFTARTTELGAV